MERAAADVAGSTLAARHGAVQATRKWRRWGRMTRIVLVAVVVFGTSFEGTMVSLRFVGTKKGTGCLMDDVRLPSKDPCVARRVVSL